MSRVIYHRGLFIIIRKSPLTLRILREQQFYGPMHMQYGVFVLCQDTAHMDTVE
jgi:hypothetical protein